MLLKLVKNLSKVFTTTIKQLKEKLENNSFIKKTTDDEVDIKLDYLKPNDESLKSFYKEIDEFSFIDKDEDPYDEDLYEIAEKEYDDIELPTRVYTDKPSLTKWFSSHTSLFWNGIKNVFSSSSNNFIANKNYDEDNDSIYDELEESEFMTPDYDNHINYNNNLSTRSSTISINRDNIPLPELPHHINKEWKEQYQNVIDELKQKHIMKLQYEKCSSSTHVKEIFTEVTAKSKLNFQELEITINCKNVTNIFTKILIGKLKDFENISLNLTNLTDEKLSQLQTFCNITKNKDESFKVNIYSPVCHESENSSIITPKIFVDHDKESIMNNKHTKLVYPLSCSMEARNIGEVFIDENGYQCLII